MTFRVSSRIFVSIVSVLLFASGWATSAFAQNTPVFAPGNLVVVVEGCGVHGGTCTSVPDGTGTGVLNSAVGGYGDNQAAPLTLFQYTPSGTASATFVNSLVLPQTGSGANLPVSSEYGSSSEGTLQLSGGGQYLTLMGYGINAAIFDAAYSPCAAANPPNCPVAGDKYGAAPSGSLAQSGSLTGQSYTPIPRVIALIDANGNVNSSTPLLNIFNNNNPRSVYTLDGFHFYVSGQGNDDLTGGVFYTTLGSSSGTAITGTDTVSSGGTLFYQDTRTVQIFNNILYVSFDSKEGTGFNRSGIGSLGANPTSLYNVNPPPPPPAVTSGPTALTGFQKTGKVTITTGANTNGNPLNNSTTKVNGTALNLINLSPSNFFFAAPNILYIADTGNPKNDSQGDNAIVGQTNIGDGGLQKWMNSATDGSGTWTLKYTLYQGLNLVSNVNTSGTSGLYGLAAVVNGTGPGATVSLYATTAALSDLDQTYLYGITDTLSNTTPPGTSLSFSLLATAPADSNFKGVSFAPTIPAGSVEVTTVPSGLTVSTSGAGCPTATFIAPSTQAWTPGSTCTLSVATPQSGTGVQYVFNSWEDSSTNATRTVNTPATTATYTASFTTQYQLTTSATTGGSVSAGGFFNAGASAVVTATPSTGYDFTGFTGTTVSTTNPLTISMNGPQTITANFVAQIPTRFVVSATSPETAGTPFNFTVTALDQFGNPATTYSGTVHFSSSDTLAALPANTMLSNGAGMFLATLNTGGTQTITAADTANPSITGVTGGIAVSSTASFVGADKTTQGNWMGVYGKDAFDIAGGPQSSLSYGTFAVQNQSTWTYAQNTSDKRALETDGQGDRTAATWYNGTTFSFDVNLTDSQQHEVSLYLLDWDSQGRAERVTITDANNPGAPLDTRIIPDTATTNTTAANFGGGTYLIWNLSGHVTITITRTAGPNGVAAGIFFGGSGSGSAPGASATNFQTDTTTAGSWLGVYGGDGYDVAQAGVSLPSYDQTFAAQGSTYVWNSNPVATSALETGTDGASSRIAATWYSSSGLSFDVNLADGQPHRVALYAIDWDNQGRAETIKIQDASSGTTLDTENVSNFSNGVYLSWTLTGHVTITVTPTAGPNAVISGIFWGGSSVAVTPATAAFVSSDVSTQGAWMGKYGSNGFSLANAGQNFLIPATFAVEGAPGLWTWESNPNPADPKDLQTDNQGHQIAAAWYSAANFSLDLNLTDGNTHQVALYLMDWDNRGRAETVQISDANSNATLDTRAIPNANTNASAANFANGAYLIWTVKGHVVIKITSNAGPNAVVSGVFID